MTGTPNKVVLCGYPVALGVSTREHIFDWVREFQIIEVGEPGDDYAIPRRLRETVAHLSLTYAEELSEPDAALLAAHGAGLDTIDLTYPLAPESLEVVGGFAQLLLEVDSYCRARQLLSLPRSRQMVALQEWTTQEFTRQASGLPAETFEEFLTAARNVGSAV